MNLSPEFLLSAIICITLISFIADLVLDWINLKHQPATLPDAAKSFYDAEKYIQSLAYTKVRTKFSFITASFGVVLSLVMLLSGGFGWLYHFLQQYIESELWLALAFFGSLALASDILTLPFQVYSVFVIEEKFGFNQTTTKTFITDKLKGYIMSSIIGGGLLYALLALIKTMGPDFWIWFWILAAVFMLIINMFYTTWILPLFNKLTPLPDGELKTAIENFAKKVNFPLTNIYVMDGSKRSKKANAFFSGIGKKKKIVLYDTLINNHTTEELVAVLAHEVGHYKKRHVIFGFILSVIQIGFTLWMLSWMIFNENLSLALGATSLALPLNLIAFTILFSPISGITGLFMNMYSRKNEFEADAYAKETYDGTSLATALKKLSVDSLSNLYPHPAYVFIHYSHPPLLKRLAAIERS